jgi:hypothetical protein
MRQFGFAVALLTISGLACAATHAAEIEIPSQRTPENISIQKAPPNCSRWTDECVSCARGADGEAPVCSNIGVACQPKAIRCLSPAASPGETPGK